MKRTAVASLVSLAVLIGCGTSSNPTATSVAPRGYSGTASVGDFLTISLDPAAHTITYTNHSNGDSGTVSYAENANGTYAIQDPTGNLVSAYEVPNYGLLIEAAKTGPNHNTPALITAIQQASISLASIAGHQYNYMMFRTSSGGLEVGSVSVDAQSNITTSSYQPYAGFGMGNSGTPFFGNSFPAASITADPSGKFLKIPDVPAHGFDYVFGTSNGLFAVDTPSGGILGFSKASTKSFQTSYAGTYKAVYYTKVGVTVDNNDVESGTPSLDHATVVVDTAGQVTATDPHGNVLLQATLTPVEDAAYLYGPGELQDPCHGLFTLRVDHGNGNSQDIFVTFVDRAMLFASFVTVSQTGTGYEYMYGVGLK